MKEAELNRILTASQAELGLSSSRSLRARLIFHVCATTHNGVRPH